MKHEKEWYTCDRCGKEIKEKLGACSWIPDCIIKKMSREEMLELIQSNPYGYVGNVVHELPEIEAVTIVRGYKRKNKIIHLCGKCRKEFKQFMKMENR